MHSCLLPLHSHKLTSEHGHNLDPMGSQRSIKMELSRRGEYANAEVRLQAHGHFYELLWLKLRSGMHYVDIRRRLQSSSGRLRKL